MISKMDADQNIVNYSYDSSGRMIKVKAKDITKNLTYGEGGEANRGLLTSISHEENGIVEMFSYNYAGGIKSKVVTIDNVQYQTNYSLEEDGNTVILPNEDKIRYKFKRGHLDEVLLNGEVVSKVLSRNPFGKPDKLMMGDGNVLERKLNEIGKINSIYLSKKSDVNKTSSPLLDSSVTYDINFKKIKKIERNVIGLKRILLRYSGRFDWNKNKESKKESKFKLSI